MAMRLTKPPHVVGASQDGWHSVMYFADELIGVGTVTAVNSASSKVTLDHGPLPEINWPAMKMEFATAPSVNLSKIKPGDKVRFTLKGSGNSYTVQSMNPAQ